MPANFPTAEQIRYYGRFADILTPEQLGQYFHLTDKDYQLVYSTRYDYTRLGIAIQIGAVRYLGDFLSKSQWNAVPANAVQYVATQLGLEPVHWQKYLGHRQTVYELQELIRQHYAYRDFHHPKERFITIRWLFTRTWLHDESPSRLFDLLILRLKERKVLLPGITTLEELINHIRDQVSQRIWARLNRQLSDEQRQRLQILVTGGSKEQTPLDRLRQGPVDISAAALQVALERIKSLRQMGVSPFDISWLAPDRLKKLARHAGLSKADALDRLSAPRKWATLAAFVYVYETRATDETLDLFDALIQTRLTRVGNQGEKKRIRTLRDLDAAARHLGKAGKLLLSLDPDAPVSLNQVFFNLIPREQFATAVTQVDNLTRPPDDNYYELLLNHYSQFRQFLPTFWHTLKFEGLESEANLLKAITFLQELETKLSPTLSQSEKRKLVDEAPRDVITPTWKPYVVTKKGHIDLRYYTFCVLSQLREALRRRSIFVSGSDRWGDIRNKLLSDVAWHKVRTQVCRSLGHPTTPDAVLETFEVQMDAAYQRVGNNLPANTKARLETVADKTRFILEPLEAVAESKSLLALRQAAHDLLPRVTIADIVQEVATWTRCLDDFTHASEGDIRAQDLHLSLCAVLLSEATNLGLSPFVDPQVLGLTNW